ncbi:LOW QUALITY PROTEIN: aurachin C monooxygenase/isomerase-like [Dioscorea cayenensis subsp. rotundata]|uniref:LOW QUALITY PROTEIN: aurachin C monooxygenase/isomerase-like n=1 Tax=Dioscorea cayennensis subsp. rotundata TaxID=55577 RepID=A0AB40CSU8_DIOCR|nr:LOW QUALITY PROTEIN: aurachin C monooxygenase/isomerase-like [Dioscorea cayenensis subsp. rotundata]
MEMKKAIVVGGSIAGLSCAHALIAAGWTPVVIEKSAAPPDGSPTGAGLCLDPQALRLLNLWIKDSNLLHSSTLPLSIDLNQVTDSEKKISWDLAKDENFGFRAAHWADLHKIIYKALPANIILCGHQFISFEVSDDKAAVKVKSQLFETGDMVEIVGDLLVAADGCLSSIRRHFFPDFKLRYSGYSAWRGVLDCSGQEHAEIISNLRKAYPEFGQCLYFDLADRTHCVLYELKNKRINWIWYINMPEPELKGSSVTMKVNDEMIENMHEEAEKVWVPELARVMRETKGSFINVIYDSNPLPQLFWDNVVLVGDAAHPTTPHGVRSTNMSILDAGILGHCLGKWGSKNIDSALREFQAIRLPVVSEQVLHARQMGRMKQGLVSFNPKEATLEECLLLLQRSMPYFEGVPFPI